MNVILFVLLTISSSSTFARGLTATERSQDFTQLQSLIAAQYGPLEYKTQIGIIDLPKLNATYADRIQNVRTNQEFFTTLVQYVAAFQDGHFGVRPNSTRSASVPFTVDYVGGKVLISYINPRLPEKTRPF